MYNGEERRKMPHAYPIEQEIAELKKQMEKMPKCVREAIAQHEKESAVLIESFRKSEKAIIDKLDFYDRKFFKGNGEEAMVITISKHSSAISDIKTLLESNKVEHAAIMTALTAISDRLIPVEREFENREKLKLKVWGGIIVGAILGLGSILGSAYYIVSSIAKIIGGQ